MKQWPKVAWSDAGQILDLIEADRESTVDDLPAAATEPHVYLDALVDAGRWREAVQFIAHALPRYEGIVWAVQTMLNQGAIDRTSPLVVAILRWIDNPDDAQRRAVWAMAETAGRRDPARDLGTAVFMSGGSIADPDFPPVLAPHGVSAKMISVAVLSAAYARPDPLVMLRYAIDVGRETASRGGQN